MMTKAYIISDLGLDESLKYLDVRPTKDGRSVLLSIVSDMDTGTATLMSIRLGIEQWKELMSLSYKLDLKEEEAAEKVGL